MGYALAADPCFTSIDLRPTGEGCRTPGPGPGGQGRRTVAITANRVPPPEPFRIIKHLRISYTWAGTGGQGCRTVAITANRVPPLDPFRIIKHLRISYTWAGTGAKDDEHGDDDDDENVELRIFNRASSFDLS